MTVSTICNPNVTTAGAGEGVVGAAALMREKHVGDLIVGVVAKRVSPDSVTVGDTMTRARA